MAESYPSAEKQSVYSTAPAEWATKTLIGWVLLFYWAAVSVFYNFSWLGHQDTHWQGVTLCRETVCVFYSSSWMGHQDTHWQGLTPLQRSSQCILQLQPNGPPGHSLAGSYTSTEQQLVYSTIPADWATRTLIGRVLPLCREAVSVFYISSWLGNISIWQKYFKPFNYVQIICIR